MDSGDEPVGDADSGMSTSHSPEENFKQFSSLQDQEDTLSLSPVSPGLDTAATRLELLDPTHRGLHRLENISVSYLMFHRKNISFSTGSCQDTETR